MSVEDVYVREGVLDDAPIIAEHNLAMAVETESLVLDPDIASNGVRNALINPSLGSTYFVAVKNLEIVGQLMVNQEWVPQRNASAWWIQSVYVRPEHRRNGYYTMLFRHVREMAKSRGAIALKLYVDHGNKAAKEAYTRLGMHEKGPMYELTNPGVSEKSIWNNTNE